VLRISLWSGVLLLLVSSALIAQDNTNPITSERKRANAVRVEGPIHVDGLLDDHTWELASPISDFIQKEPQENAPPTEDMEVRFAYDDGAIYIGARMYNRKQTAIQAPLGRRDLVKDQAEYVLVSLDTFHDRRTAYAFGVTATGVRLDRYYPGDDETVFDEGFEPVWQARTNIQDDGWTAELWIPFSQLRFNEQPEQVWGLNVQRFTPNINEMDYWQPVPRTVKGWSSRFGDLRGIEGIRPSKRIEVMPFTAGSALVNGNRDHANPFDDGRNLKNHTGADLKMGLGPDLTLEATVNPDFGQVEADPAEVNLSALETFFPEKRPFFLEDSRLLNTSLANNFFNSRRVGAPPTAPVSADYVDYPQTATILTAAKLTGRLVSGTSIGILGAMTGEEFAHTAQRGSASIGKVRVAPRANWGLVRIQQEFGPSASTVSGMFTAVHRDLKPGDPLAALLNRNAFTASTDSVLRFKRGEYELRSYAGVDYINGDAANLERIQRSAVHYMQRPDRDYGSFDPTRTSLTGYVYGSTFERTGGRHWLWFGRLIVQSPAFNTNDMGRITTSDSYQPDVNIRYRETRPGRIFRNYSIGVTQTNEWNFGGNRQDGTVRSNITLTFLNFWTATIATGPNFAKMSQLLTRGGPLMRGPKGWTTTVTLRNRAAARNGWNASYTLTTDEAGGRTRNIHGGISFTPKPRWQFSVTPTSIHEINSQQYVATVSGGPALTYGQRYIFSFIDRSTWSSQFRLGYTLRPDLNVDIYAEPFAASGHYYGFGELAAARTRLMRLYGTDGTTISSQPDGSRIVTDGAASFTLKNSDFNTRSFRSNVVLRWEWRPGSILYLVWQQNRRATEAMGDRVGFTDMFRSLSAPGSNFFAVKMSFWLPVK
jgi:Domain of unknown function (DUF5916)